MRGNRRRSFCHISLAFGLKLLNYLMSFVGISIVLYSAWMLNDWNNHHVIPPFPPPIPAPSSAAPPPYAMVSGSRDPMVAYGRWSFWGRIALGFGNDDALRFALSYFRLPAFRHARLLRSSQRLLFFELESDDGQEWKVSMLRRKRDFVVHRTLNDSNLIYANMSENNV